MMPSAQTSHKLHREIVKTVDVRYLLYLPKGYEGGRKRWPLMLFLHGAGERGNRLSRVRKHGPPKVVESGRDLPFIIVSPQCPPGEWWQTDALLTLLDEIAAGFRVDAGRVYLTGLSMGGRGTWTLAIHSPHRFAAIVPVCGWGEPFAAFRLKDLPTWAFHGAQDPVVPVSKTEEMVAAMKRNHAREVRCTIYPEAGHDSWTETYNDPRVYRWLLKHRRSPRGKPRS